MNKKDKALQEMPYHRLVIRIAKDVKKRRAEEKKARADAVKHAAHALAWRECADMLGSYESADPEHDTPLHKEMRARVMQECYRKADTYQDLADAAKAKGGL